MSSSHRSPRPQRGVTANDEEDVLLLTRIGYGDRAAFERLYRAYYPRVFNFLLRMTGRADLVEETVNDVMLAVWRGAAGFRGQAKVSSWVLGIAYRLGLKALARFRRQPEPIEVRPESAIAEPSVERELESRERGSKVRSLLGELSPEHRAVVELTYYEGLSYPEIAQVVRCPVNTVKTRMFHARRRLRRLLTEDGPGCEPPEGKRG